MPDPITGIIAGGATLLGGAQKSKSASEAADAQAAAAQYQADISKDMFDLVRGDLSPYRNLGPMAMPGIMQSMQPIDRTNALGEFYRGPEYAAMAGEAENRAMAAAEAGGGLGSSPLSASLKTIAPSLGTNYLNQLEAQRMDNYNRNLGLLNIGQNAAAQTGAAGQTYASQAGQAFNQMGQAQAQNALAQGNIMGDTLNTLAGGYMGYQLGGF